ncbi:MAG: tetratricopeptide repeat protein [Deltaproteobacteria bacterium]
MSFVAELRRRNVIRAGVLYMGAVWALAQGIAQLGPSFGAPEWIVRWFVIATAIGFPFWLSFAWFYEWTPQGLKRESELAADASIARDKTRKLDRVIIAVLAIAVVLLLTEILVPPKESSAADTTKSIAVLPFVNMSGDKDNEYFSDGISEEILNALAQVRGLKVAGRTSSFYYKGRDEDLRTIGKALGVANILEGSVRKQGDRVRITAQLIRVADDSHLWSQAYDGDLSDVFKTQENVARAITEKLQVALVGIQKTQLVAVATLDTQAHSLYLQAREAYRARGAGVQRSIDLYRAALKRDPKFALAWAGLCGSLNVLPYYQRQDQAVRLPDIYREAEDAGLRAIELDPGLAAPHVMLGNLYANHWRWRDAEQQFERAQALAPPDSEFYFAYTDWLGSMGQADEALDAARRAVELDPKAPAPRNLYGYLLSYSGRYADSVVQLEAGHALAPDMKYINRNLVIAYAQAGRFDDAEKLIRTTLATLRSQGADAADIAWFEHVTESMLTVARDPSRYDAVRRTLSDKDLFISSLRPMHVDDLFVFVRALFFDRPGTGTDGPAFLRSPVFDGLRKDPRYLRLLHQAGFDDAGVPL